MPTRWGQRTLSDSAIWAQEAYDRLQRAKRAPVFETEAERLKRQQQGRESAIIRRKLPQVY